MIIVYVLTLLQNRSTDKKLPPVYLGQSDLNCENINTELHSNCIIHQQTGMNSTTDQIHTPFPLENLSWIQNFLIYISLLLSLKFTILIYWLYIECMFGKKIAQKIVDNELPSELLSEEQIKNRQIEEKLSSIVKRRNDMYIEGCKE